MNRIIETVVNTVINSPVLLNFQSGITKAKNEVVNNAKFAINSIVIPVACVILAGVLVALIVSCAGSHKRGEDYSDKIKPIAIVFGVIVLVATAPLWVWDMVGA